MLSLSANVPVRSHVTVQMPALQPGVPPLAGQTLPHIPQLLTVSRLVSQPFGRLVSQSPQPLVQLGLHAEATQLTPPCGLVHAVAQLPQCCVLVASAASQPLLAAPSQSS
jgi:hypothetical protein